MYDDEFFADDIYDDTIGNGEAFDEDDGVLESILIIGITMSLVFLLWWRQRMQQAHAQAEDRRRREQGLPPRPPAENPQNGAADGFPGWAAGGMGL